MKFEIEIQDIDQEEMLEQIKSEAVLAIKKAVKRIYSPGVITAQVERAMKANVDAVVLRVVEDLGNVEAEVRDALREVIRKKLLTQMKKAEKLEKQSQALGR